MEVGFKISFGDDGYMVTMGRYREGPGEALNKGPVEYKVQSVDDLN